MVYSTIRDVPSAPLAMRWPTVTVKYRIATTLPLYTVTDANALSESEDSRPIPISYLELAYGLLWRMRYGGPAPGGRPDYVLFTLLLLPLVSEAEEPTCRAFISSEEWGKGEQQRAGLLHRSCTMQHVHVPASEISHTATCVTYLTSAYDYA